MRSLWKGKGQNMSDESENEGGSKAERIRTHVADGVNTGRFMEAFLEL